jgi:uncharacterized sulfatase
MLIATVALAASIAHAADAPRRPNVLLILADDLSTEIGCYGSIARTPNLDALAKDGTRFDRAYTQYPLCGPSRCSFLSGLRPDTTGVLVNGVTVRHVLKDVVTLPQHFRNNGYFVARAGKAYHLGIPFEVGTPGPDDPLSWDHTFDPKGNEFPALDDGDQYDPDPKNQQSFRRNLLKDDEGKSQADYQTADEIIRLLKERRDRPFFLTCGFIRPHVPQVAPRKYFDLYDVSSIKLPPNPPGDRDDIPAAAFQYAKPNMGMTDAECVEAKRGYHAVTSFMDHQVGRVLAELDRLGLRDSTIVVFASDHGYLLGQHQGWQKTQLWEESARVPLIISYPGMPHRDATATGLAELVDLYPTVCDLAGVTPPTALEGRSLRPALDEPAKPFKEAVFTQVNRFGKGIEGRSVRTDRWRYSEWNRGDKGVELYDHQADPGEYTNLAKEPAHATTVTELRNLLHAHSRTPATAPATAPTSPRPSTD